MVSTKVLDEALRGGEPARLLEEQCKFRMHSAEQALQDVLKRVPDYIAEAKERHPSLLAEGQSMETELEMLGESLDDITERSRELLERAQRDAQKKDALNDLAIAIVPFVKIAEALQESDAVSDLPLPDLQRVIRTLNDAVAISADSQRPQLVRTIPELDERIDEATAMMKTRYMDTFEIHPQRIFARGRSSKPSSYPANDVNEASAALAKAGLLEGALSGLLSELIRNGVAKSLSQATIFFESEVEDGITLEWSAGVESSAELLEFDLDDIDNVADPELDAMSDNLDIANTAARALKIFDVFRERVVGKDFSRDLAFALQPWFSEHIVPSSVVLSTNRSQVGADSVPRQALRSRATAVSACAKVIQTAMRSRGAQSFVLVVEMDSLENKVGSECRGQAVLTARQAIASFSNAWHNDNEMVTCPIAADTYIPRAQRPPEYFPPCLVTQTAITVRDVFMSTKQDAVTSLQGGSTGIGNALSAAALECLRAYREDVPLQHAAELRASLRLKALYYNDCMMLAHSCKLSAKNGESEAMEEEADRLEEAANKAMMVIRRTAEQRLVENLNAACRNGALGAYGTLIRIQRSSALSAAFNAMREVVKVFADIVPTELAELAAGRLLEKYLTLLCNQVVALSEISAEGCEQIDAILQDADNNVNNLMNLVSSMEVVRGGAPPPEVIGQMRRAQNRLHAFREILNARMEDIVTSFRSGKYEGLINQQEIEHFIRAIFEDTSLRAGFLADLGVSLKEESEEWGEWGNSNW